MATTSKLVVGLGNPGKKYEPTRHNIGRRVVEAYLDEQGGFLGGIIGGPKRVSGPGFGGVAYRSKDIIIVPDLGCYMNESGRPVQLLLSYFKIEPGDLTVVHDEVDLPLGETRVSTDSSAAGHNGVSSIINALGTKKFRRLRIGIESRSDKSRPPTDQFVLQRFTDEEEKEISTVLVETTKQLDAHL